MERDGDFHARRFDEPLSNLDMHGKTAHERSSRQGVERRRPLIWNLKRGTSSTRGPEGRYPVPGPFSLPRGDPDNFLVAF
jgi:hypothetical protein